MRLLIDQMWPARLAEQLRRLGHDAVAVLERHDLLDHADEEVWEVARREGRAVFTENVVDYVPLATACLSRSESFYGLILTSNRAYPRGNPRTLGRAVAALDRYLEEHPAAEAAKNQIHWLPANPAGG